MKADNTQQAFFALLRAGLWEKEVRLLPFVAIDYDAVLRLAAEQSVIGLVTAGLEHVCDTKVPKNVVFTFMGNVLQIEKKNIAMNAFIADLVKQLDAEGIKAVLLKGQGIAQCYEKPLWRTCGDVDLLLDEENYRHAKAFMLPRANKVEQEFSYLKHIGMQIGEWEVELHGRFRSRLSRRIDSELDGLVDMCVKAGGSRPWHNDGTTVLLPAPDIDVLFIFTHLLRHFYFEGVGLRQICDWCRLLWTYHSTLDIELLRQQLHKMHLMSEWQAFGAFAVEWLEIPAEIMPFYSTDVRWSRKAKQIQNFVMRVGNFGHNQIKATSATPRSYLIRKFKSFWQRFGFVLRHFPIFPIDSLRFLWQVMVSGLEMAVKRE